MQFTVITPTGGRPKPFALCCRYLLRQNLLPVEWIVVDDGAEEAYIPPFPTDIQVKYIRRVRRPDDPKHTLPVQILTAMQEVTTDYVLIMEDDDWYAPSYTQAMLAAFASPKKPWIVGQGETLYYHYPARKYFQNKNKTHASLCQTGFKVSLANQIKQACHVCWKKPFLDLAIWNIKAPKLVLSGYPPLCVGMKGLPGREGTTMGWNEKHPRYKPDKDFSFLRTNIGDDVELYRDL
jgi:glycosyltransferase involved in cell wall biosynthesis